VDHQLPSSEHSTASEPTLTSGIVGLARFARGARGRLALAAVLAALSTAAELLPFYALYRAVAALVDGGVGGASGAGAASGADAAVGGELTHWAWVALVGIGVRYVLFGLALYVSHLAAYDLLYRLRIRMAEHLARLPLGWFSRRRSGGLKKVMADDVERLELFLAHAVPDLASAVTVSTATTVWLLARDWRMGLAAIVVVPVAFACMARSLRRSNDRVVGYHQSMATMNAAIVEHVRGLPVVKVFNRSDERVADVDHAVRDHARWVAELNRRFLPLGTAFYSLIVASIFVVVPVGAALHSSGHLATGDLLFYLVIGLGYGFPMARLHTTFTNLSHISFGGNLVNEVLATPALPERADADGGAGGGAGVDLGDASVDVADVSFAYSAEAGDVLHGVTFSASPGTVTALVGLSGGGKSTIARLIARFWDVGAGAVRVGGVDVRDVGIDRLMDAVAFVFQDAFLFDDTVEANLRVGRPAATFEELRAAARAARMLDTIEALPAGWSTRVGERGARLSGGERQRMALARAILKDAPVVVLDEATSFVDPENEALIQDAISELVTGKTVVMIAHRLSTVAAADQILVVDRGRIVERGRHDSLVAAGGLYAQLWDDFVAAETTSLVPAAESVGQAGHAGRPGRAGDEDGEASSASPPPSEKRPVAPTMQMGVPA
jgi:ATP-binding cassette subfamily B protein